jgi:hypothetical protein
MNSVVERGLEGTTRQLQFHPLLKLLMILTQASLN